MPIAFLLVVWTLTTHGKYSDSGDEPHYLIVAESLFADLDLDLANNYRDGHARWFGADDLEAGPHARVNRQGVLWSTHDVGVSIAVLPVYAVATRLSTLVPDGLLARIKQTRGLFAYSLVSLSLMLLTACGIALLQDGLSRIVPPGHAAVVSLAMALSPPVLSHAFLVFPETLALFVTCAVVWLLCHRPTDLTRTRAMAVIALVGLMPWLHRKYAPISLGLAVLIVAQHRAWFTTQPRIWLAALTAVALTPQLLLHAWTVWAWGALGGPQMLDRAVLSASGVVRGALGLVFDRERGLVGHAPIYLLAPACLVLTWRDTKWLLATMALLFVPMAAFVVWGAGFSPAARYLVPLMPLLAVPAARSLEHRVVRRVAGALLAVQLALVAVLWNSPRLLWPKELGTNDALRQVPIVGPLWERALPSLLTGDPTSRAVLVVAIAAALTAFIVVAARRGNAPDKPRAL